MSELQATHPTLPSTTEGGGWNGGTPVAMFIFNRPEPTAQVFARVRAARPKTLLIVADGPRADRPGEAEQCRVTRRVLDDHIDWECQVHRNYADTNLGCKHRVASGLDWVFATVPEAIILEDDCVPDPSFFPYCQQMLERYRDDPRIMSISGDNFLTGARDNDSYDYYFSRYILIWGWASWRRAWQKYDSEMKAWPEFRDRGWVDRMFGVEHGARDWQSILTYTYEKHIDTWDYQLTFSAWAAGMMGIHPSRNLVTNIGFNSQGTHTRGFTQYANKRIKPVTFPLRHPPFVIRDSQADAVTQKIFYSKPTLWDRIYRKSVRFLRSIQGRE